MLKHTLLAAFMASQAFGAYLVKQTVTGGVVSIESVTHVQRDVEKKILLRDIRDAIAEKEATEAVQYQEWLLPDDQASNAIKAKARAKFFSPKIADAELREIVRQGPDENRIILTVLGDGYTLEEKEKFFQDVDRIVTDMFREVTFKSYLPLFNIYAIFVPSKDSGITDITRKETAFGLYRSPRSSKRGVMPGDTSAIERALRMVGTHTDYPIIIANDDFYGGLGGRYAITTRSMNSGSMVLRHELGHNFSNVGEEYDGGQVYSGANFSSSSRVPWGHWVEGELEVHRAKFLTGSYVWQDLFDNDFEESFSFPEANDYFFSMKLSSVGWSSSDDVAVYLNGEQLELEGVFTEDRSFFTTKNVSLSTGKHTIRVEDKNRDGDNVLAYANGYAYPLSYNFTPGLVGAFNVFDESGRERGYRPTHKQCLMRDMRSKVFCPVDQENIWIRFLDKVQIIDDVVLGQQVEVMTPRLPNLDYRWYKSGFWGRGEELVEHRGKKSLDKAALSPGKYEVEASFSTPEIRLDTKKIAGSKKFEIR